MLSKSRKPMQQQALRNLRRPEPSNLHAWPCWIGTGCADAWLVVPVVMVTT